MAHPIFNQVKCEVCDCTLSHLDLLSTNYLGYLVCRSFDCRRTMSQKSSMPPAAFSTRLKFQKSLIHERSERAAKKKKYIEEIKEKECNEHSLLLHSVLKNNPELTNQNTYLLTIPSGLTAVSPLTQERISSYTEHLRNIISQATQPVNDPEVSNVLHQEPQVKTAQLFLDKPALRTISDRLCGMCQGGCCPTGNNHAYLTVMTISRCKQTHPDFSDEEILDLYLCHLNSETIEGACINQTSSGCALPRELRSDTCNEYYCQSLLLYQQVQAEKDSLDTVLAIKRSGTNPNYVDPAVHNDIIGAALIDEEKLEILEITLDG